MPDVLDFRSDLVARPTEAMIAAITAALGEPGEFEFRADPHERALAQAMAHALGQEAALFFPTCTMANQAAIATACRPGDKVVAEAASHIITSEGGAPAAIAGVMVHPVAGAGGRMDLDALARALVPAGPLAPRAVLVVVENTHSRSAGAALPPDYLAAVATIAADAQVPIHIDGARLFNAAVALDVPAAALTQNAQSVAVSLNKGLCAPMGAMLAGSEDFIARAARVRQRLGGGVRPIGFLAAAAREAMRTMPARLAADHGHAAWAARELRRLPALTVIAPEPITNLVAVEWPASAGTALEIVTALAAERILALAIGPHTVRFAFHREIDAQAVARLIEAVAALAHRRAELPGGRNITHVHRRTT